MPTKPEFEAIDPDHLSKVAGGAARSKGSDDITSALTAIQDSLKDLASSKNNSAMDPMQMILIMMMMGGFGGGGGGFVGGVQATPPVVNVDTGVSGGGIVVRGCGKKGW